MKRFVELDACLGVQCMHDHHVSMNPIIDVICSLMKGTCTAWSVWTHALEFTLYTVHVSLNLAVHVIYSLMKVAFAGPDGAWCVCLHADLAVMWQLPCAKSLQCTYHVDQRFFSRRGEHETFCGILVPGFLKLSICHRKVHAHMTCLAI